MSTKDNFLLKSEETYQLDYFIFGAINSSLSQSVLLFLL